MMIKTHRRILIEKKHEKMSIVSLAVDIFLVFIQNIFTSYF